MDIRQLLRWKEDGIKRPGWSEISDESPSFKALWAQLDSLHVDNGLLKRAWESPDRRHVTKQLVVSAIRTKEVLGEMHNGGSGAYFGTNKRRNSTGSVVKKTSRTGARSVRCNYTTSARLLEELQEK